jgi:Holliday junction resolvase RusA-like endonuclease
MREIRFTAFGRSQPQGSKNAFKHGNRVVLVEASKGLKPWRSVVSLAAKEVMLSVQDMSLIDGPVAVDVIFTFVPGRTVKRKAMTTKPDIDKLARAILDSLTGVCWRDDAQVVELRVCKVYGLVDMAQVVVIEL